jgi:uncharacterized membrane protein YgaE (UPF0421/DUF939 family)
VATPRPSLRRSFSWQKPTSAQVGLVLKSAGAAGLSWWIALRLSGVHSPVLAPLTAIISVQVSVRASLFSAVQRSGAIVAGVLVALAIGDALPVNALTVGLLVGVSLAITELVLHLPASAARQVPISALIVLTAVSESHSSSAWDRAENTLIGAAVGLGVSVLFPASRLHDAQQTLGRLTDGIASLLRDMAAGLREPWSTDQTEGWRRTARTVRDRHVDEAKEAVGNSQDAARWNIRDRRHVDELARLEEVMHRLERTAIGVSVISRGLDDHARLSGTTHRSMTAMGALLDELADAIGAVAAQALGGGDEAAVAERMHAVRERWQRCLLGARRRAREAWEGEATPEALQLEGEWLGYGAILVQVDRIVDDLGAPLPS